MSTDKATAEKMVDDYTEAVLDLENDFNLDSKTNLRAKVEKTYNELIEALTSQATRGGKK